MPVDETFLGKRLFRTLQVGSANKNVDILCIANRGFVHFADPGCDRVPSGNGIGNLRPLQRFGDRRIRRRTFSTATTILSQAAVLTA